MGHKAFSSSLSSISVERSTFFCLARLEVRVSQVLGKQVFKAQVHLYGQTAVRARFATSDYTDGAVCWCKNVIVVASVLTLRPRCCTGEGVQDHTEPYSLYGLHPRIVPDDLSDP